MNERASRRTELNLSQTAAAARAGVSLATWRRWEEDPESVSAATRRACARVVAPDSDLAGALAESAKQFEDAWMDDPQLTPRQAYALALTLNMWADGELREWIRDPQQPLHEVAPFDSFDRRVMFRVGENRAWAAAVLDRCHKLAEEIEAGVVPFARPGALIDEVLVGAALPEAENYLTDMPELFDNVTARDAVDDDDGYLIGDEDWDAVSDGFDDQSHWDEWEVPVRIGHVLLPAVLAERHPYTWFDLTPPTGPGYLMRLAAESVAPSPSGEA